MAPETENIVLEHLRHIRGQIDRVADDVSELKTRMGRLEIGLAQVHVTLAEHSNRDDRIEARLDRIEKRLNLVDAS